MKLFVDDMRACPEGWVLARTVTEAIRILDTKIVYEVSLDHDIACRLVLGQEHSSNETFEPVARYLALYHRYTDYSGEERLKVRIHTANFEAGHRLAKILGINGYNGYIYNPEDYK